MDKRNNKRNVSDEKKFCPMYDKCSLRLHPLSATDNPNMAAHLGFRSLYTSLAWFLLGYDVSEGFFTAMFFFILPVFMDCIKFTPLTELRKRIKRAEVIVSGVLLFISALGVLKTYTLTNENGTWQVISSKFIVDLPSEIGVEWIWGLLILIVFVTGVDWICSSARFDSL